MIAWRKIAVCLAAALVAGAMARSAEKKLPTETDIAARFRPFRTEHVALAPDGRHLAYTQRQGATLYLVIVEVDHPETRAAMEIGTDDDRDPGLRGFKTLVIFNGMTWASANRLVYAANIPGENHKGEQVRAVDADGRNHQVLADGERLGGVPRLLGFRTREPNTVTVAVTGEVAAAASSTDLAVVGASARTELELAPKITLPSGIPNAPEPILDTPSVTASLNESGEHSTLYAIDVATGKFQALSAERTDGTYLYDQQGNARIMETAAVTRRAPIDTSRAGRKAAAADSNILSVDLSMISLEEILVFNDQTFRYREARGKSWQDLDKYLAAKESFVFRTSLETHWGARSFPVAFDADPNILYFASNRGRDTYGLYALDLRTKRRTDFAIEDPEFDLVGPDDALSEKALVFDRQRRLVGVRLAGLRPRVRWLDRELARQQTMIETRFPGRDVEILDWDDARQRLAVRVSTLGDPGRYFLVEGGGGTRLTEFLRTAPWFGSEVINSTEPFAFDSPAGVHLTGTLTMPRAPRVSPLPLIVVCEDILAKPKADFDREVQALADLGCIVAQVNYRGTAGLGARHRDGVKANLDLIPVEDVMATVNWVVAHRPANPRRVALFGEDYGGYVALRALQLHPSEFRCAVTVNAPASPAAWAKTTFNAARYPTYEEKVRGIFFDRSALSRTGRPALGQSLTTPVLFVQDERKDNLTSTTGKSLREELRQRGIDAEYLEATVGYSQGDPDARAKTFRKLIGFLNEHLYDFGVNLGEAKEVK